MKLMFMLLAVVLTTAVSAKSDLVPDESLPLSAAAQSVLPLTLEEATRLALEGQPLLAAQSALVAGTREDAVAAGELPDPRLRFGVINVPWDPFSLSQEGMTQIVVGISQRIPGGNKLRLKREGLLRQAERDEAALEATRRNLIREVGRVWLDLWYAEAALKLVQDIEREYARQVEWAQTALTANRLSLEQTLALRVMREYVIDRKSELTRLQSLARAGLSRWIGEAAYRPLSGNLVLLPTLPTVLPDSHPELRALQRDVSFAKAGVDLALEAYKPDWTIDLTYGMRGGNRADLVSAQVSVDLPLFTEKRQDRQLAGKLAAVERAQQQLQDRKRQLKAGMEAALADWEAASRRIEHFESVLVPLSERRVESALAAYRAGKGDFPAVLEARREALEARLKLLAQQVARARAAVELRYFSDEGDTNE